MNLEEKAKRESIGLPQSQKHIFRTGFETGYNECKSELIEFLQANQKATVKQVLEHLNQMK